METGFRAKAKTPALSAMADRAARDYGWRVKQCTDGAVKLRVVGEWSDYDLTLFQYPDRSGIEVKCSFALAPPRERWVEVSKLAERLNGSFHRGRLELRFREDHGTYTDWVPMNDVVGGDGRSIFETMRAAVGTCDMLLFPAFHCVAWAEVNAETALDHFDFGSSGQRIH